MSKTKQFIAKPCIFQGQEGYMVVQYENEDRLVEQFISKTGITEFQSELAKNGYHLEFKTE